MGAVLEPEGHPKKLERSERCHDCGFGDMSRIHRDLVVGFGQIDLREDGLSFEPSREIGDERQLVRVVLGGLVQAPVISTRTPVSVWLRDTVERRRPRRVGATYYASG